MELHLDFIELIRALSRSSLVHYLFVVVFEVVLPIVILVW